MRKPAGIFDRDSEWADLVRFASTPQPGAMLGVVGGRRRQGKTVLLDGLVRAVNGFIFHANESVEAEALRLYGDALSAYLGERVPLRFANWDEAITRTMSIATNGPLPVVIDEFPLLARSSPALPSIIQRFLEPAAQRASTPIRLLLSGSDLPFMDKLLSGQAPLYGPLCGRASLEMVVSAFDYRRAARFWELDDPRTALLVHAVVGGTPAYRRGDIPASRGDFDDWVVRAVLNPARALFWEAHYLLAEETDLHDSALCHSTLAAIAENDTSRDTIATFVGRRPSELNHVLGALEDVGLVSREHDAFQPDRLAYRIAEPLVAFHHAIMRPAWGYLERAAQVWSRQRATFLSNIVGPHFEAVCRQWTYWEADPDVVGGFAERVAAGTVPDAVARTQHEVDVAAFGLDADGRENLLAIGEAKWNEAIGVRHLQRLAYIRGLLQEQPRHRAEQCRLLLFSGVGFTEELKAVATGDSSVHLIDIARLYTG